MSASLTELETREAMKRAGVGPAAIEAHIARTFGPSLPIYRSVIREERQEFPIRITLPWSHLVSDNDKYGAVIRNRSPRLVLSVKYKAAKEATRKRARDVMQGFAPLAVPLALVARVYVPDNRPGHDVANFAKCCLDAMQKVVYRNDDMLHDVRFIRAGVDVDRPRADIEIAPL